jgi:hypothetical protein
LIIYENALADHDRQAGRPFAAAVLHPEAVARLQAAQDQIRAVSGGAR